MESSIHDEMIPRMRVGDVYLVSVIACVGALLRLWRLPCEELSVDETFTWQLSRLDTWQIIQRTAHDVHPPGHYLILKAWSTLTGSSVVACRTLSVLFGVMACIAGYLMMLELPWLERTSQDQDMSQGAETNSNQARRTACFVSFALATHFLQVEHSQDIRMYAQGMFLAVLSAWFLLRMARTSSLVDFLAYTLTISVFVYTHNFAILTILGQVLFVGWNHFLNRQDEFSYRLLTRTSYACVFAAVLYSPWLAALRSQTTRVYAGYWIEPLSASALLDVLTRYAIGIPDATSFWRIVAAVVVLMVLAAALRRSHAIDVFFLAQFLVPWVVSVEVTLLTSRPVFLERTLIFAFAGFLGLLAIHGLGASGRIVRWLTVAAVFLFVLNSVQDLSKRPREPPAITQALFFLKKHFEPGDVVVLTKHNELYRFRCYAEQIGLRCETRCVFSPFRTGQALEMMALAMNGEDIIDTYQRIPTGFRRAWLAGGAPILREDQVSKQWEHSFVANGSAPFHLSLLVPVSAADHVN